MADHMRTCLIIDALTLAATRINIRADVTIFHSDRGCQYQCRLVSVRVASGGLGGGVSFLDSDPRGRVERRFTAYVVLVRAKGISGWRVAG